MPGSAADVYHKAIAGSTLLVFERWGHRPEIERAEEFVSRVQTPLRQLAMSGLLLKLYLRCEHCRPLSFMSWVRGGGDGACHLSDMAVELLS